MNLVFRLSHLQTPKQNNSKKGRPSFDFMECNVSSH